MQHIDLLFNLIQMLVWVHVWNPPRPPIPVGPYLAAMGGFTLPVLEFLRFRLGLKRLAPVALAAVIALLLLRAAAWPLANPHAAGHARAIHFGFTIGLTNDGGFEVWLAYSALSFASFLFHLWSAALILLVSAPPGHAERAAEFLYALARPFSDIPLKWQPPALLAYGVVLSLLVHEFGPTVGLDEAGPATWLLVIFRSLISAVAAFVRVLVPMQRVLIFLIIMSWVGLFGGSSTVLIMSREWMDLVLGMFRRFRLQVGFLDLAPVVAFLVFGGVYQVASRLLLVAYRSITPV